ncbi:hypothetical protein [Stutzerimonas nitrititolerans]|uniref:hypothetical protein n=1 Tax=Stutzerimonas nitrititolerans TaxID=2482751 RepID=UPI0028ACD5E8|nr:hypothetical protein [Stutzerimonas nitrititolerans]
MADFYYKSDAPAVVALVREWFDQKAAFDAQLAKLGQAFGAKPASMRDVDSHYAGGLKLGRGAALDVHWRLPDDYGYRSLRTNAVPPKGASKAERQAVRAEHERLVALWQQHCPRRISSHDTWEQLGINTGNLLLCGGVMFELNGTAYFLLGFQIDQADHLANSAASKPTSGWIDGAIEILPSEYEAARRQKLEQHKETSHA